MRQLLFIALNVVHVFYGRVMVAGERVLKIIFTLAADVSPHELPLSEDDENSLTGTLPLLFWRRGPGRGGHFRSRRLNFQQF